MDQLNYKHLHYFWMVVKSGGVGKAGERLHVTPQSISGQIRQLEASIGEPLWRRAGRQLELTEMGHLVFDYSDRLFSVGEQLKDALRGRPDSSQSQFRVGVSGAVVKIVAYKLLKPALDIAVVPRLLCREGRFTDLLALLAVHRLDLVLSDRPMSSSMNVRGFNHLLEECGISFLAVPSIARRVRAKFPASLDNAPVLLPGDDTAVRSRLLRWFDDQQVQPRIVGDFDDTAVMKSFGSGGAGIFMMPSTVAAETCAQFKVEIVQEIDEVIYQTYAISGERRLKHPAVVAISEEAHKV